MRKYAGDKKLRNHFLTWVATTLAIPDTESHRLFNHLPTHVMIDVANLMSRKLTLPQMPPLAEALAVDWSTRAVLPLHQRYREPMAKHLMDVMSKRVHELCSVCEEEVSATDYTIDIEPSNQRVRFRTLRYTKDLHFTVRTSGVGDKNEWEAAIDGKLDLLWCGTELETENGLHYMALIDLAKLVRSSHLIKFTSPTNRKDDSTYIKVLYTEAAKVQGLVVYAI